MTQIITRNGLPTRHVIDGMRHLCTDEVGHQQIESMKGKYVGRVEDTPEIRAKLRREMQELLVQLKHQGRLFRKDGDPLV